MCGVEASHQDFGIANGEEPRGSSAGAAVPVAVHLLHHGHHISCPQAQLQWTLWTHIHTLFN